MMLSPVRFLWICGFLVALGAVVVALEVAETQQLRRERNELDQAADTDALKVRKAKLSAVQEDLRVQEQLGFGAGERDLLQQRIRELRGALEQPSPKKLPTKSPPTQPEPDQEKWRNVGRANPSAAFETTLSALARSDVDQLTHLLAFDEAAQAEAQRLYDILPADLRATYDTKEQVVASLMAVYTPIKFGEAEIIEEVELTKDQKQLTVGLKEHSTREVSLTFQRDSAGWKLLVPALIIDGYRHRVLGTVTEAVPQPLDR